MDTPEPDTQPEAPGPAPASPRRLTRPRTDRAIGGACAGFGRYLGVDPVLIRIAVVVLTFIGGAGILLYLAGLLLMPVEDSSEAKTAVLPSQGLFAEGRAPWVIAAGIVLLILSPLLIGGGFLLAGIAVPLAMLAACGLITWWITTGDGATGEAGTIAKQSLLGLLVLAACHALFAAGFFAAGVGGGAVAAGVVIAAGVALVIGAFAGRVRWLILPALSVAIGVGFVSAAGIELDGGWGELDHRPAAAADLRQQYDLSMGQLTVDLRGTELPAGDTPIEMDVGVGLARLVVPKDVCVASRADIGMGAVDLFDRNNGGVDLDWEDSPRAAGENRRVIVDADIGVGALEVRHDDPPAFEDGARGRRFEDGFRSETSSNTGCTENTISSSGGSGALTP